jgi:hypothetical protein
MEQLSNSRLITWPSTVEKSNNHTVVLVDATSDEIEETANFFRTSYVNFDLYVYEGTLGELEYLGYISNCADCVLIKDSSNVQVNINHIRYGTDSKLGTPIEYFKEIERKEVDSLKI